MLHEILVTLGGVFANELFNRIRYGAQLKKHASELVKLAPKGTARDLAEQAIIRANFSEMETTIRHIDEIRANADAEWRDAVTKAEAEAAAKRQRDK